MLDREELHELNIKIPQAITYLVESSTKLLQQVAELEDERDEYRRKWIELSERINNDQT